MTMIGAISCLDGVVMLADAQETIPDYAKWSVQKLKLAEINGALRVAMVGAGTGDTIDMIWEYVSKMWHSPGGFYFAGFVAGVPELSVVEWRSRIVEIVRDAHERAVAPWGSSGAVDLIWMVQVINPQGAEQLAHPIELFRTFGTNENSIKRFYFGGSPTLLSRFLSEQYLQYHNSTDVARALAAYMLWEGKENDPNVGKRSDIVIFKHDGSRSEVGYEELAYWEDHFKVLKREMAVLPLLSCVIGIAHQLYDPQERMERLSLVMKTLFAEQEKMREGKRKPGRIDELLTPKVTRLTNQQVKRKAKRLGHVITQSETQTSEGPP